jgi:hypothetical protein
MEWELRLVAPGQCCARQVLSLTGSNVAVAGGSRPIAVGDTR